MELGEKSEINGKNEVIPSITKQFPILINTPETVK